MSLHRVRIPIVDADPANQSTAAAQLWEVNCGPASGEELAEAETLLSKDRILAVQPLSAVNRYPSGRRAYLAVRRLLDPESMAELAAATADTSSGAVRRPAGFAIGSRRARSSDGGDWVRNIKDSSSDLGIALCLLMAATQSKTKLVAATGELGDTQDIKDSRDVPVKPVGGVETKLRLLIEKKRDDTLPDELSLILTPKQHIRWLGEPAKPELELVEALPEVAELQRLGLRVCPVATLGEAAGAVGIDVKKWRQGLLGWQRAKRIARWALAAAGLALAAIGGLAAWAVTGAVPLHWEARPSGEAQPFIVCQHTPGKKGIYAEIRRDAQQIPIVPADKRLGWRVQVGKDGESQSLPYRIARHLFGYQGVHLMVVVIGKKTGIRKDYNTVFIPNENVGRMQPGRVWSDSINFDKDKTEEENLLVVIAQRTRPFAIAELKSELGKNIDFERIKQYVSEHADGSLPFFFETRSGVSPCAADSQN